MIQQQSSFKYTVAAAFWTIFVLALLTLRVDTDMTSKGLSIPGLDKIAHMILFGILTTLVAKAMIERKKHYKDWALLVVISLYGIITELIQLLIRDRHGDVYDAIANIIGVMLALLILRR